MQIKNKNVLLTGGANGIGFACAEELLRNGAGHVAILDLEDSNLETAVAKLNGEFGKGRVIHIFCDVSKPEELKAGFVKTVEEFGGLDIVINNAGIMDDSRWELMIDINVNAVVRGTLLGLQYMGKDEGFGKGGLIVNIASIAGLMPVTYFPIYAATKHAVIGLSRSFGAPYHYERTDVRVLTMCPGVTQTKLLAKLPERTLETTGQEELTTAFSKFPSQTVENVAQGMMQIIRSGQNGSVWVAEGGDPVYQILIPDRRAMKVDTLEGQ